MFFLFLMTVHNNPFERFLTVTPTAGEGLSPLLQNFYMAIHPPMLYLGFVGMTIPFAFGMAALASGQLDDSWLRAVRRWTMSAWMFLTVGLALGSLWAYEELGWGGIWMWDPVENAGLLPWFTATAFLHSVMVQERRGMLKVWNVSLVIVTFFLTIFGTFMTRSGVVQSVHAFGEDRELAWMFTVFMIATVTVSFGMLVYRLPLLRSRNEFDSWMSREAAFLANRWVLLVRVPGAVRDDVPDSERALGLGASRSPRRFQSVDDAAWPHPSASDRHWALLAWRKSARHGATAASLADHGRRARGRDGGARDSALGLRALLRALRARHGDDRPGILARCGRPATRRHRSLHGARRTSPAHANMPFHHSSGIVLIFLGFAGSTNGRRPRTSTRGGRWRSALYRAPRRNLSSTTGARRW